MKSVIFILLGFISIGAHATYKCSTICTVLESHSFSIPFSAGQEFRQFEAACDERNTGAYAAGGSYMQCDWDEYKSGEFIENTREWNSQSLASQELDRLCGRNAVGHENIQWPSWAEHIVTYSGAGSISCIQ